MGQPLQILESADKATEKQPSTKNRMDCRSAERRRAQFTMVKTLCWRSSTVKIIAVRNEGYLLDAVKTCC